MKKIAYLALIPGVICGGAMAQSAGSLVTTLGGNMAGLRSVVRDGTAEYFGGRHIHVAGNRWSDTQHVQR